MNIDGKKRREIREALIHAFPLLSDLSMLADEVLNERLQNITNTNNTMPAIAFELIGWAIAHGRLTELVIGAASANPTSGPIKAVAAHFEFVSEVPGEIERIVFSDVPFENIGQWLDGLSRRRRAV